jgi:hypothetical protein
MSSLEAIQPNAKAIGSPTNSHCRSKSIAGRRYSPSRGGCTKTMSEGTVLAGSTTAGVGTGGVRAWRCDSRRWRHQRGTIASTPQRQPRAESGQNHDHQWSRHCAPKNQCTTVSCWLLSANANSVKK